MATNAAFLRDVRRAFDGAIGAGAKWRTIKVGTLDNPSVFGGPQMVTWTSEMQKFHLLPADVPAYPEIPGRKTDGTATATPST